MYSGGGRMSLIDIGQDVPFRRIVYDSVTNVTKWLTPCGDIVTIDWNQGITILTTETLGGGMVVHELDCLY